MPEKPVECGALDKALSYSLLLGHLALAAGGGWGFIVARESWNAGFQDFAAFQVIEAARLCMSAALLFLCELRVERLRLGALRKFGFLHTRGGRAFDEITT